MLAEVWPFVRHHRNAGRAVALARVVRRAGDGGRRLAAAMAVTVTDEGVQWSGSVAGGCVDGDVLVLAAEVLSGSPATLRRCDLGPDSRPPWEDGPACQGSIWVLVSPLFDDNVCSAVDLVLSASPSECDPPPPVALRTSLLAPYETRLGAAVTDEHLVEVVRPAPRLVLVGATDVAVALAAMAAAAGFRVVVLEPRPAYAQPARVRDAVLVCAWPSAWLGSHPLGPDDALIALTHEPRLDDAALVLALRSGCGYVAAIGSRATHTARVDRLAHIPGVTGVFGPAGLDLGGASSAQTALSMLAEVVAVRNGRDGGSLVRSEGRVHA